MGVKVSEQPVIFSCAGDDLLGIITNPENPQKIGVLIVVGGPQYRVGSHRQFLLLSRALASAGYPTMRFDFRGMGDSAGGKRHFEEVSEDIAAAIDVFMAANPSLDGVVLWGLCDAASASLLYLHARNDVRLRGMVLLNPWVRSEATLARTHIKHYYFQRLMQREFWQKLLSGKLSLGGGFTAFFRSLNRARQGSAKPNREQSFQEKMRAALSATTLPALLILSGDDYTAKEFIETTRTDTAWQNALSPKRVTTIDIAGADHTFSSAEWRQAVERATLAWLNNCSRL